MFLFASGPPSSVVWGILLGVHAVGLAAQFLHHYAFDRRRRWAHIERRLAELGRAYQ